MAGRERLAGAIVETVRALARPYVADGLSLLGLLVLLPVFAVLGIGIFLVTGLLLLLVPILVGLEGPLLSVVSVTWFVGSLVVMFFAFRAVVRRLPDWIAGRGSPAKEVELLAPPPTVPRSRADLNAELSRLDARLGPSDEDPSAR